MDSSDNLTRTNGMKVARCYAKIVGHKLQFEGLEDDDDDDDDGEEIAPTYTVEVVYNSFVLHYIHLRNGCINSQYYTVSRTRCEEAQCIAYSTN